MKDIMFWVTIIIVAWLGFRNLIKEIFDEKQRENIVQREIERYLCRESNKSGWLTMPLAGSIQYTHTQVFSITCIPTSLLQV